MKRTLILLSLFAVPGILTSCKEEPDPPQLVFKSISFSDSRSPEERKKAYEDGYEGKIVDLHDPKIRNLLNDYYNGACSAGHMDIVLQCLENGADPGRGLLYAALGGHMNIVQLMLDKGATDYDRALARAAEGGHMDIVQLMLDKGADPNWGIARAAEGGHMDIVQLMLDKGATDYNKGLSGAASGGHMDIVQLMLKKGADPNWGIEPAAEHGHLDIVQLMLDKGAGPYWGLCRAAMGGHPEIVKLLLAHPGIDVNKQDPNGITPLDLAERNGKNSECAELIRAAGGKQGEELNIERIRATMKK